MEDSTNKNEPLPADVQSAAKAPPQYCKGTDLVEVIHFEFKGTQHTVKLLTSRSSVNVVMEVDGVTHRCHVTLKKGVEQQGWLNKAELISMAKKAIDPSYGALTDAELLDMCRRFGL